MLMRKARPDTRHAVVTIATRAQIVYNFSSTVTANEKLAKLQRAGGKTNTQEALELCARIYQSKLSGVRKGSFKQIFLVTDGHSNIRTENTLRNALQLKLMGVEIFAVGVGDHRDGVKELMQVASSIDAHLYRLHDMQELIELVRLTPTEQERNEWWREIERIQEDFISMRGIP